jgi:hypothetical protein
MARRERALGVSTHGSANGVELEADAFESPLASVPQAAREACDERAGCR